MRVDEAKQVLDKTGEYFSIQPAPGGAATLDGLYTIEMLEAIITLLQAGVSYNSLLKK